MKTTTKTKVEQNPQNQNPFSMGPLVLDAIDEVVNMECATPHPEIYY